MKTKISVLGISLMLSLLGTTEVAFALAEVETHSHSGWVQGGPSGNPAENATLELMRKVENLQQEIQVCM